MKHLLKFASAALICALAACSDREEKDWGSLTVIPPESTTVSKHGGEVAFEVSGTARYTPMTSETWCETVMTEKGFNAVFPVNASKDERRVDIAVAAPGFPFFTVTLTQEAGDPSFSIAIEERSKVFGQEGGDVTVLIAGNVEYTVEPSQDWLTVSNITPESFTLSAAANGVSTRDAVVLVRPEGGFQPVTVNVRQSGIALLQNGNFIVDGVKSFEHWEVITSPADAVELLTDQYTPSGVSGAQYYMQRVASIGTSQYEGTVLQKLTDVPDGVYELSCQVAGWTHADLEVSLISIDKAGNEAKTAASLPGGGWRTARHTVTVSGGDGECTVGIRFKALGGQSFKALDFNFK
ncbi:MAG: BACON domain-containing protein [Tannerella sp.]|jgi:hypothetical protein|nr:BACON domain-containing protein [Tannerella sp.]